MPERQILTGANVLIPANTIPGNASLDNRHNVAGNVSYQIGAAPQVNVPLQTNEDPTPVPGVNNQTLRVINGLTSSIYVVY